VKQQRRKHEFILIAEVEINFYIASSVFCIFLRVKSMSFRCIMLVLIVLHMSLWLTVVFFVG